MMKRAVSSFWLIAASLTLLVCCTSAASAQVQFALTSVPNQLWGEDTSPYGTNNPAVGNVTCDDILDATNIGQNYTYEAESFSTLISQENGIWFGSSWYPGATGVQYYQAVAWLVQQVYQTTGMTQAENGWAIWSLFDPSAALSIMNSNGVTQAGCTYIFGSSAWNSHNDTCVGGTGGIIGQAFANGPSGNYSNLEVYIPLNASGQNWCANAGTCQSQEFFGLVPEGGQGSWYLLLSGIVCLGGALYSRRQSARNSEV